MRRETLQELGEFGLIKRIAGRARRRDHSVLVGIGDDAAVIDVEAALRGVHRKGGHIGPPLLVTTDSLVEDVHFRRNSSPQDLGWKALAVNISDIAAMGGIPRHYLLSLSLPEDISLDYLDRFVSGMRMAARKYGMSLIGGDTTSSPDKIYISITVLGEASGRPLLRSGARIGDIIYVTGTLGDSALGLRILEESRVEDREFKIQDSKFKAVVNRHLRPTPRVKEGLILAKSGMVNAMIDVSDGLLADLGHICDESGVGARVWMDRLPLSRGFRFLSGKYGGIELAMRGGEDYELLFTARDDIFSSLEKPGSVKFTAIGEITRDKGVIVFGEDGKRHTPKSGGFDHFRG